MRIIYQLLIVLFIMLQGIAGQHRPFNSCAAQNGYCTPGTCQYPFRQVGRCPNGFSCCRR
ncbi:hypothetical protein N325_12648, partial [Colius striatus]